MTKESPKPNQDDLKRLALIVAVICVRNTIIEDYHSQGKLSDKEMMAFNKVVANKLFTFLYFMFDSPSAERKEFYRMTERMYPHNWDTPKLDDDMIKGVRIALGQEKWNQ